MSWLATLLNESPFAPHGFCLNFEPSLLALTVVGDALTALAYVLIPIQLLAIVRRAGMRRLVISGERWVLVMFASFILLCGLHHALQIVLLWHAFYWLDSWEGLLQGSVSLFTSAMLQFAILPELRKSELRKSELRSKSELRQRPQIRQKPGARAPSGEPQ
ncbi:MAG: hypothetical protein JO264_13220 [Acidisphaera sp.]|nr:hypothetical protein [Acidisphaera sp.]